MRASPARRPCCSTKRCWPASAAASSRPASSIPKAVTRSMEEFRRFRALSEQAGAERLYVLATAAAREAVNGPDFIHRAEDVLGTEIRVLSGARGGLLFRARRHLRLPSGRRHRRRPRRRQPRTGRRRRRGDRRGHHAAARRPAPAGHGQELAGRRRRQIARDELAKAKLLKGGQGRTFYAVGGTWRNLARLHMNMTGYPLSVMHHYEMGVDSSAELPRAGRARARSRRSRASRASRRTAARCCLTAPSCCWRSSRR